MECAANRVFATSGPASCSPSCVASRMPRHCQGCEMRTAAVATSRFANHVGLRSHFSTRKKTTVRTDRFQGCRLARRSTYAVLHEPSYVSRHHNHVNFGVNNQRWDVLGLGQAIVDFSATVTDDFLNTASVSKGGRRVISVQERGEVLSELDGSSYAVNAGGSLSNSLVALARLGLAEADLKQSRTLKVALGGSIGEDALGEFYRAKIEKAGLAFLSEPEPNSATGTVVVLTTPDAQRSFLSYPGSTHDLLADAAVSASGDCRLLVIEGYLWEMPGAREGIGAAIRKAKAAGAVVAMTAGDSGVAARHREPMLEAIALGVDVAFTNAEEAAALAGTVPGACGAEHSARELGSRLPLAVVTDGSRGAFVAARGRVEHVGPHWAAEPPVDTCGAGDAFAAGFLYGLLKGYNVRSMAAFGAQVASCVISRFGARLKEEDAVRLVADAERLPRRWGALEAVDGDVLPLSRGAGLWAMPAETG
uniref:PfkB-type carbohydrate kinase n=1 Tax=Tetraselmis sp. GSL018 TaxID=582737 RepID=A0A061RV99_9CHLO